MNDFWKGKKVFLTGHTGFKGAWLAFWLDSLGADVCGYSLVPDSTPNLFDSLEIGSKVKSVIANIRDLDILRTEISSFEPDIVFHLAAQSLVRRSYREPVETYATNLMGTVNVLEAIRTVESVRAAVIITTDKVYENEERSEAYIETEPLGGFDPYSSSKACAEIATSAYRRSFFEDGRCLIATTRAGNVIGGGDWSEDRLIPDIFRSVINGEELVIRNPGAVRPWQHVLEPLSGYMLLAEKLFAGENEFAGAWNFGPSEEDSRPVSEVLELIRSSWNGAVSWNYSDVEQPHEAGLLKLDSAKAVSRLGWKRRLSLTEAVGITTDWYRAFADKADIVDVTLRQIQGFESS